MKFFGKALFALLTVVLISMPAMAGSYEGTDLELRYQQGTIAYGDFHLGRSITADDGPKAHHQDKYDDGVILSHFNPMNDSLRIHILKEYAHANDLYLSILWDLDNSKRFSNNEILLLNLPDTEWQWVQKSESVLINGIMGNVAINEADLCGSVLQSGFRVILSDAPINPLVVLEDNFDLSPTAGEIEDYRLNELVQSQCVRDGAVASSTTNTETSDENVNNSPQSNSNNGNIQQTNNSTDEDSSSDSSVDGQNGSANGSTEQQTAHSSNDDKDSNENNIAQNSNETTNQETTNVEADNGTGEANPASKNFENNGQETGESDDGANEDDTHLTDNEDNGKNNQESTNSKDKGKGKDKDKTSCNAGRGNDSEPEGEEGEDCDPGNSGAHNQGGD